MTILDHAISHIRAGRPVFRLKPNSKLPFAKGWQLEATLDERKAEDLFTDQLGICLDLNIGISTENLLAIDIDIRKNGFQTIEKLKAEGLIFPPTYKQRTPTGGEHWVYAVDFPIKGGTDRLGSGVDIKGKGGYIVGAGSSIDGREYICIP